MKSVTRRSKEVSYFRSPRLERAQHINNMQSRAFNNQMEIMEKNIKKKLKVWSESNLYTFFFIQIQRKTEHLIYLCECDGQILIIALGKG